MAGRRVVAVAGTHGKTTTTSLLTVALQAAGADPTYADRRRPRRHRGSTRPRAAGDAVRRRGRRERRRVPALPRRTPRSSPTSRPTTSTTGGPRTPTRAAFDEFARHVDPDGFLVCCVDDPGAAALAERQRAAGRRVVTVSTRPGARPTSVRTRSPASSLVVARRRTYLADALAAPWPPALTLGFADAEALRARHRALHRHPAADGAQGRGRRGRVYDSYAHHPTEIAGDLEAARALAGEGRVVVAFQPHLVSRTRLFGAAMGEALGAADEVVVCDVYLAREDADPEVTGALVAGAVPLPAAQVSLRARPRRRRRRRSSPGRGPATWC